MTSEEVLSLYKWFKENDIIVWIDGGWCVDALLGKQTREHPDLDIAVSRKDSHRLRDLLESKGYKEEKRNDATEWMYVMKSAQNKEVDVHAFEYGKDHKNIY